MKIRSGYELPEGVTTQQVTARLIRLVKPCNPMVTQQFTILQAFKPFYDPDPKNPDQERLDIVFDRLYQDVKDMPEVAVVLAIDDLRNVEGRYFPLDMVLKEVKEYKELIFDALDFFGGNLDVQ